MKDWKYKIGDFVTPIVHHKMEHATKMVVTGRITEEYAEHTERGYICSHYKLGDYVRQKLYGAWSKPQRRAVSAANKKDYLLAATWFRTAAVWATLRGEQSRAPKSANDGDQAAAPGAERGHNQK